GGGAANAHHRRAPQPLPLPPAVGSRLCRSPCSLTGQPGPPGATGTQPDTAAGGRGEHATIASALVGARTRGRRPITGLWPVWPPMACLRTRNAAPPAANGACEDFGAGL